MALIFNLDRTLSTLTHSISERESVCARAWGVEDQEDGMDKELNIRGRRG